MRTLLLGLLATATAATVLYSTNPLHHLVVNPIAGMNIGYRFYDHFCRVHYNNQTDRNACMMRGTSTLPPNSECDKSLRIWEYQFNSSSRPGASSHRGACYRPAASFTTTSPSRMALCTFSLRASASASGAM
jgi:hypothetical protein